MRKFIGFVVYVPVQVLFIPLAIVGVIIAFYKQTYVSKNLGVSATAVEIINGRWTMDKFGLRKDNATVKLFNALPNTTGTGLWLALFPLYLLNRITGENLLYPTFKEAAYATLANLVTSRTVFFDVLLQKSLQTSEQFVVMGAGLDTRCYGDLVNEGIALYELDQMETQEFKKKHLQKASVDISDVNFVSIDFTTQSWYEELCAAGFDNKKKTTFLWEGVTLYLSETDVKNTLREISSNVTEGSVIIADFYATKFVSGEMIPGKKMNEKALKLTNEELAYGIRFEGARSKELEKMVKREALKLGKVYYMGSETPKGTYAAVAEILI